MRISIAFLLVCTVSFTTNSASSRSIDANSKVEEDIAFSSDVASAADASVLDRKMQEAVVPAYSKALGQYTVFETDSITGETTIQVYEDGPTIQCTMKDGRGNANPRHCQSGSTYVTMVDAKCPTSYSDEDDKNCFAASIIEGLTGMTYYININGDVTETASADYPLEDGDEEYHSDSHSDGRSLLRSTENSVGINFNVDERKLQGNPVIDVLVVYTQGALNQDPAGGPNAMEALINLAIAESNNAFDLSGINAELRLALLHEDTSGYTADVGSTDTLPSLNHLTDPNDGQLDYVHDLREEVCADMVQLITTGAACGRAWINPSRPDRMFSLTERGCVSPGLTFVHELAHNMGCEHDRGQNNRCGDSGSNFGYRDPAGRYRSIMGRNPGRNGCDPSDCDITACSTYTRLPFFSNPDRQLDSMIDGIPDQFDGEPMGHPAGSAIGETNNVREINRNAEMISNFFDADICASTQPPTKSPTTSPTNSPSKEPTSSPTKATTSKAAKGGGKSGKTKSAKSKAEKTSGELV